MENRSAPLDQRLTDNISLGHRVIASCFSGTSWQAYRSFTATALSRG